ncbi:MAG: hypothetical protein A3F11_02510 [Gammaproteobacteria bacterium RIFCSPHIGHO2_12_FULL_37_14]|nr:MAG: hypothetical protein A3F11_02510 [Gammaproteobacteria bacterium RIFCSPHIGHO2_12_FULL_37_14]
MKETTNISVTSAMTVPLKNDGILKVSGMDAKKFLQGQLTCDVNDVAISESRLAAHCNPQGRIVSLFYLAFFQEAYFLLMPSSMIELTMQALKRYAVFYKVTLADVSNHFSLMGCVNVDLSNATNIIRINIPSITNRYVVAGELIDLQILQNQVKNVDSLSTNDWKFLDMMAGIPAIYPETSAKFLPHEINLFQFNAISLNKGCYTGQEIIARMHYRGKLKKHLYHGQIACQHTIPVPGMDIYRQESHAILVIGVIVDVCPNDLGYDALIMLDESDVKDDCLFLENDPHTYFYNITKTS